MDGPYKIDLTNQNGHLRLRFIKERAGGAEPVHKDIVVDADSALRDALSAAGSVLNECRSREWQSDDITLLAKAYTSAQSERRASQPH